MKSEEQIRERLKKLNELKEAEAEMLHHGFPECITTYEGALIWVLEDYEIEEKKCKKK